MKVWVISAWTSQDTFIIGVRSDYESATKYARHMNSKEVEDHGDDQLYYTVDEFEVDSDGDLEDELD